MANIDSKKLVELFEKAFSNSVTYKRIGNATNPFHIIFDGVEYYVYIKNVSSAHFDNSDVWRAQLTGRDVLQSIKESDVAFILLGYDDANDVYATWNPHQLKQRIGTAKSPSLYSRLSIQEEAAKTGVFVKKDLNNNQEVLVFRREQIVDYLVNLDQFFPDTSEYVAMGSRRRTEANKAYRELVSPKRINAFEQYLIDDTDDEEFARSYARAMRLLVNDNYISKNRKIFLACNSLSEYMDAYKAFLELEEIKKLDSDNGKLFTDALEAYILFLQEDSDMEEVEDEDNQENGLPEETQEDGEKTAEITDWETPFMDSNGNLTRIANPELLELLKPDLLSEYQSLPAAYNTILEFYGEDRFPNMQMKDWNNLFKTINWDDPAGLNEREAERQKKKQKRNKLWVQTPDGEILNDNQVQKTFVRAIEKVGPELVRSFNIQYLGDNLVTEVFNENYATSMKPVTGGYYVNTNSSTGKKYEILKEINRHLEEIDRNLVLIIHLI